MPNQQLQFGASSHASTWLSSFLWRIRQLSRVQKILFISGSVLLVGGVVGILLFTLPRIKVVTVSSGPFSGLPIFVITGEVQDSADQPSGAPTEQTDQPDAANNNQSSGSSGSDSGQGGSTGDGSGTGGGSSESGGSSSGGSSGSSGGSSGNPPISNGGNPINDDPAPPSCALPSYPDASCTGPPASTSFESIPAPTLLPRPVQC